MRIYNMGTEVFEFNHAGLCNTVLPKYGTFKRKHEPYTVEIQSSRGGTRTITRHKDVWVKVSDEGVNSNFIETAKEVCEKGLAIASAEGLDCIKSENLVIKSEMDKVAAVEKKVKEREEELKKQEQELNLKMAMLKKVEEEAISKAAAKHK